MHDLEYEKRFGLSRKDLLSLKKKLTIMGLELKDILTFLDRDKVQLFAEQKGEIYMLKREISLIDSSLKKIIERENEIDEKSGEI